MRRFNANKKRNSLTMFASFVVLTIVLLTIGYSALQNTGIVSDITAKVRPEFNIRITDIQVENTSDAIVVSKDYNNVSRNNTYTGKALSEVTFTKTTSSVKYKIEILNIGNVEMGIASITGLPSNLEYELDTNYYDIGEKICDNTVTTQCTGGARKTIYVTIKYKSGSGTNTSTNLSADFDLNFKEIHNISYNNTVLDYVIDGGNKTVSLGANPPTYVRVNGTVSNSSYSSPNVSLTGVTSDITIEEIHKIYIGNVEESTVAVHGGNVTIDLGQSAPASASNITISGTYSSSTYNSPNLTINGVTTDIYITISSGSGGNNGGTWEQPVEDTTTTIYDPVNDPPPEGTTLYTEVAGEPEVTVENGKVTRFEYTDIDSNTGISTPSGGLNTGVLAFDGEDFTVTLTAEYAVSNINGGSTYPVLDLSSSNPADQTVDGFLVLVALNYGGTNYNESDQNIGSTNSSKKYMKWRFNKYVDGGTGTSTGSQDYYSNAAGTAYYTYRFATLSTTIETTIKIYCRNNVYTSDLLYNNVLKARPRYASANNERKYTFDNPVTDTTIKLGYWKNKSGQEYTTNFTIKEFSVVKE